MPHFVKHVHWFWAFLLLGMFSPALAAQESADYLTPYNALLSAYVHTGDKDGYRAALVDYKGWAADKNHVEAMQLLARVQPEKLSGAALTAFWLNAYNLLTIDLIVRNQQQETIKHIGTILDDPWKTFTWQIGGKTVRLNDIDREKLPMRTDVRLYFALANTALSGPDLRQEAYMAEKLDAQLDDQVRQFLNNDKKGLKILGTVLQVSKIFQRHAPEFEAQGGVAPFLRRYHPATPANGVVQGYFEENWNLNGSW